MRVMIVNGPNLNLIGKREQEIYGDRDLDSYLEDLKEKFKNLEVIVLQSNVEGELVNYLQEADNEVDYVVLNAGAYTHTSLAIADVVAAISIPVVEVHISNIAAREEIRQTSLVAKSCIGSLSGFGLEGYHLALEFVELHSA